MSDAAIKLMERTLYPPIAEYLRDIGFSVGSELQIGKDYVDILFRRGRRQFVLEVKISEESKSDMPFLKGIVQAYQYGRKFETSDLLIVMYPYDVRGALLSLDEITGRALERKVQSMILTENWAEVTKSKNLKDILQTLSSKITENAQAVHNVDDAARIIRESIRALETLLNHKYKDAGVITELAKYLSRDYGLFLALSNQKAKSKKVRSQTIDLIAYILMNQILFYFIYSRRATAKKLPPMGRIQHPQDLMQYFDAIRKIDFAPIFDIDVASRLPPDADILRHVNETIDCLLDALRIDRLNNDIYGRLIGKSLPIETRRVLASYYTKIAPARLMAGLTISKASETVWDAACGSGTLLVSAYERKKFLYQQANRGLASDEDIARLHRRFIETDLTGTDIMPFACHLASLNLAVQNLAVPTDSMRICFIDSLRIDTLPMEVEEAYGDVYREVSRVSMTQKTLHSFDGENPRTVNPKKVLLGKVDCVLINPPFTRSKLIPSAMKAMLEKSPHNRLLGNTRMPLWAHFMGLTDRIVNDGGHIGAILPVSILHGKDTLKLRRFYLRNYTVDYIIKPASGDAFSEDSDYGDLILIARKVQPAPSHKVRFVMLKRKIDQMSQADTENIIRTIGFSLSPTIDDDDIFSYEVEQRALDSEIDNLMPYVFTSESKLRTAITRCVENMRTSPFVRRLQTFAINKGYQFRPQGKSGKSLFVRHLSDSRIKSAKQYFEADGRESSGSLAYSSKSNGKILQKSIATSKLTRTFRSIASVKRLDITNTHDYVLTSEAKSNSHGTYLLIAHRFRLNSSETFATAFYSSKRLVPTEKVTMYDCSYSDAKILCLYFNSIFYLIQVMMLGSQATYGFVEMTRLDLGRVYLPALEKIGQKEKEEALAVFESLKDSDLESLSDQFKTYPDYRIRIDLMFSKMLGLNISKSELIEIYMALGREMQLMSDKKEEA